MITNFHDSEGTLAAHGARSRYFAQLAANKEAEEKIRRGRGMKRKFLK